MKIKTKKTNSYPGDKTIRIYIEGNNRQVIIFNVYKEWNRAKHKYQYVTDRFSDRFDTITQIKNWVLTSDLFKCERNYINNG